MAKRMKLTDNGGTVHLEYHDPFTSRDVTRIFSVSTAGGYVREASQTGWNFDHQQVCERLSSRGNTLWANPENLAQVIRREYRRMRRSI